jgi:DNA-binding transcriptional LysR family regulator
MLSSSALAYFAEVARQGSFQAGAERLHVAVSAVSRQVSLLEQDLGVPLFERSRGRRPLRLTSAGEALMLHVQEIESSTARVSYEIQALRGLSKGQVRFGMSEVFIRHLFPEALTAFNAQYPGMTYAIEVSSMRRVLDLLAEGELDAGLVFNPVTTAGVEKVFEVLLANHVLVKDDHPLAKFETLRLSDCVDYDMAMPNRELSSKVIYDEMFSKANFRPRIVLESNSYEMLLTAASTGLAIAFVNAPLVSPALVGDNGKYRCVPIVDPLLKPVRLAICVHEGRVLPVPILHLIDLLKQALAKMNPT